MSFRNKIYIVVILLIAITAYFLYKEIISKSLNSSEVQLSVNDSVNSSLREKVLSQIISNDSGKSTPKVKAGKVSLIVYYFHATARCKECINIENFTKEIVESEFTKEKKTVKMTFRSLNIEDSANEHYIKDFKLDVSTVILSKLINNKQVSWRNLDHVWKYADDKPLFLKYVKEGIKDFLSWEDEI
jgi:hypothetical protein